MHAYTKAGLLPKWNVMIVRMSDLCRIQCALPSMLNIHAANNLGFSRYRYYVRPTGEDRITFYDCLLIPQRFQPDMLLFNNCLYPRVNRNQTVVKSNWCSALTQMLKSHTRKYSFVSASNVRFQEPASSSTCASLMHLNCHSVLCTHQGIVTLWRLMKRALLCCGPVSSTYFSIMQRLCVVGCSNKTNNSRCLSQKPDKDSSQKPSAKQLDNVKQLMTIQVTPSNSLFMGFSVAL